MGGHNASRFAESLEALIADQVTEILDESDLSDKLPDIDDKVSEAIGDLHVEDMVAEVVEKAMEDFDFGDAVQKELESCLVDEINEDMKEVYTSKEFEEAVSKQVDKVLVVKVNELVSKALAEKETALKAKLLDYVKFGPLLRWVKVQWAEFKACQYKDNGFPH